MAELLEAKLHARGLIRLLREYANKLEVLAGSRDARSGAGYVSGFIRAGSTDADRHIQAIRPALLNITREASGLAEQGGVGDLDRLELRLRLAEVEGLLQLFDRK